MWLIGVANRKVTIYSACEPWYAIRSKQVSCHFILFGCAYVDCSDAEMSRSGNLCADRQQTKLIALPLMHARGVIRFLETESFSLIYANKGNINLKIQAHIFYPTYTHCIAGNFRRIQFSRFSRLSNNPRKLNPRNKSPCSHLRKRDQQGA